MAALADSSKRWHIVLRCTICGPLGLLLRDIVKLTWFHQCLFHPVCHTHYEHDHDDRDSAVEYIHFVCVTL